MLCIFFAFTMQRVQKSLNLSWNKVPTPIATRRAPTMKTQYDPPASGPFGGWLDEVGPVFGGGVLLAGAP